jgi:hypothetical protein
MVIPHGVYLSSSGGFEQEFKAGLPGIYCFQDSRKPIYLRESDAAVVSGAAPWLYLLAMAGKPKTEGRGTIVFPVHSTDEIKKSISRRDDFITMLQNLPEEMQPVRVCMYWRDIQLGSHKPYLEASIPVVTAGHMFDENFADRLLRIMRSAVYLVTNELGSHIFYGAAAGLKVTIVEGFSYEIYASKSVIERDWLPWSTDTDVKKKIDSLFNKHDNWFEGTKNWEDQRHFALEVLGNHHFHTPRQLLAIMTKLSLRKGWLLKTLIKLPPPALSTTTLPDAQIADWGPREIIVREQSSPDDGVDFWIRLATDDTVIGGEVCIDGTAADRTDFFPGLITSRFNAAALSSLGQRELTIRTRATKVSRFLGKVDVVKSTPLSDVEVLDWGPREIVLITASESRLRRSRSFWIKFHRNQALAAAEVLLEGVPAIATEWRAGLITAEFAGSSDLGLKRLELRSGSVRLHVGNVTVREATSLDDIRVADWGPQKSTPNDLPNLQPDGSCAVWIKLASEETILGADLTLNGVSASNIQTTPGLVTASFPAELFEVPGEKRLVITSGHDGRDLLVGSIQVRDVRPNVMERPRP